MIASNKSNRSNLHWLKSYILLGILIVLPIGLTIEAQENFYDKTGQLTLPAESIDKKATESDIIYTIGKVRKPGVYKVDNPVTVLQALARAGGLTEWANEKEIKIIRKEGTKQLSYAFNYQNISKGYDLEQNITLRAGDVVVVP